MKNNLSVRTHWAVLRVSVAAWTGLQVAETLNGFASLMANVQHPGAAGYFGPFPAGRKGVQ